MINSNDIFEQIGLIVKPNSHQRQQLSFKAQPRYTTFLEIELGENQKHVLQIKDSDNPKSLALHFCREHRLNRLAVTLVQKKIIEAKNTQQQKLSKSQKIKHVYKQDKSKTPRKSTSITSNKRNKTPNNDLYVRAMVKNKMKQEERAKRRVEQENAEKQELTFKPKINNVSEKIVEAIKNNDIPKAEHKKRNQIEKAYDELQGCTFHPKINKVSSRIARDLSFLKQERERNNMIRSDEAKLEKSKIKNINKEEQKELFHPKINPKSSDKVTMPFSQRMQIAYQKKYELSRTTYEDEQCSFRPKIGRPPKSREKENSPIWENLYKKNKKDKGHMCPTGYGSKITHETSNSRHIYDNLVEERIRQAFEALDNNCDGLISPDQIGIQCIFPGTLTFLKPIFEEMDEIDATLNFNQFRKAVIALLNDSDTRSRGVFLSEKWWSKRQNQNLFRPQINERSRAIVGCRSVQNLYKDGVREIHAKQQRLERERALKQEQQLAQCSFQPNLNQSSKIYINKIMKKKQGVRRESSISQILQSFVPQSIES